MNIKSQKLEILQMLIATRDSDLLKEVKKVFKQSTDKSDDISEAKLASIKRGLEQIEKGQTIPHSEVRKAYEKWL
jgi:predicted transcriptional regulator